MERQTLILRFYEIIGLAWTMSELKALDIVFQQDIFAWLQYEFAYLFLAYINIYYSLKVSRSPYYLRVLFYPSFLTPSRAHICKKEIFIKSSRRGH